MDNEKEEFKNRFKITVKFKMIATAIVALVIFVAGMFTNQWLYDLKEKQEISTDYISGKLEDVGELTTQKLTYTGYITLSKGKIPFINKNGFSMKYTATMRAGMEFAEFDIRVSENSVVVKIPHADVLDVKVDSETIEFYDEKFSLFNKYGKEGTAEAITLAEKDVLENAEYSELLQRADENAEELIHQILDGAVGDRDVVVSFK